VRDRKSERERNSEGKSESASEKAIDERKDGQDHAITCIKDAIFTGSTQNL